MLTKFLSISRGDGFYEQVSKYFSYPQYYFQVNSQVKNKLKVILVPFLQKVSQKVFGCIEISFPHKFPKNQLLQLFL